VEKLWINQSPRFQVEISIKEYISYMAIAGYSGTPLLKKLGLKEGLKVWVLHPPDNYFQLLEADISSQVCPPEEWPDWVQLFAANRADFEKGMQSLKAAYRKNPKLVIWVSWYKKSSGMATDLTEEVIRGYALKNGLVDVKVCAVSELWSGLKLVVPLSKR
jgi:hypothetical protein